MAIPSIVSHLRNYASAGMVMALAGVISFPLLTRNLSVVEYGILGLITSSLTFFIAVGKLGVQQSVIRFFAQVKNKTIEYSSVQMNSTVTVVFFCLATLTTIVWLLAGHRLVPSILDYEGISSLFSIAAVVIFVRLLGSGVMNFLRAQQRSGVVATVTLIIRLVYLCLILLALLFTDLNPFVVVAFLLVAELAGVGFATKQYWPDFQFDFQAISKPLAKAMLIYGIPLMLLESLGLIMRLSDRYLIGALLDETALGMYSASYNFTSYLDIIILASLTQAIRPMYMEIWESTGAQQTRDFLAQGFHLFLVIGIPFVAIFSLVSPHLLNFLASPKYAPGTVIIPFVAFSYLLEGCVYFLAAGLYIQKNTKALVIWGAISAVINILLNFIMIPKYGIVGAAAVTVLAYTVFMLGVSRQAFKFLSFDFDLRTPALIALISGLIFYLGYQTSYGSDLGSFFVKGCISTIALCIVLYFVDNPVRSLVMQRVPRRFLGPES